MADPALGELLDFTGKAVIVTGGSRDIGAGIALRFSEAGASVVINHKSNRVYAMDIVSKITSAGKQAVAIMADVTKQEEVQRLMNHTVESFGRVDVMVNNAGICPLASLIDTTPRLSWF